MTMLLQFFRGCQKYLTRIFLFPIQILMLKFLTNANVTSLQYGDTVRFCSATSPLRATSYPDERHRQGDQFNGLYW